MGGWSRCWTNKQKPSHIAALAVVVEPEKIQVVHDGTNKIHINNCIRVRDRVRSPTAGELRALMRDKHEKNKNSSYWWRS